MTPRILILGKDGQVGFELQRALAPLGTIVAHGRAGCDLAQPEAIRQTIRAAEPAVIVNAGAYTAVDKAESEEALAMAINATAPGVLGEEAARIDALVIHYSTDYVFDGKGSAPYRETDAVNPQSAYGRGKLAGERALRASGARHLIFRTSWVFGAHGGNFLKTILRLARDKDQLTVVADQFGVPTPAALIADVTAHAIRATDCSGIYHLAPAGETTWHEYAQLIVGSAAGMGLELRLKPENIRPIPTAEYPLPAPRPANSRLDTSRLRADFGLVMPDWQAGVAHTLQLLLSRP